MLVAADLSTSGAASEPRRYVMNDLRWHSSASQQSRAEGGLLQRTSEASLAGRRSCLATSAGKQP